MGLMHIGELAKRTRLSVKTVRYYSDLGLVPEADRTLSGYRRYDGTAVLRLEFVRTLRELGLGLGSIRQVLERDVELTAVAAAHADAIGAQIRLLRIQRAALRTLARRQHTPEEVERMTRLAQATAEERHRLINEFIDSIFEGRSSGIEAGMRRAMPDLPDEPSDEQVDAWLELAALVRDEDFRERLRAMGRQSHQSEPAAPSSLDKTAVGAERAESGSRPDAMATAAAVTEKALPAAQAGTDPSSEEAGVIHDELVALFAESAGRDTDEAYRRELLDSIRLGSDPRAERYWQLIAIINGWPPIPSTVAGWDWFGDAVAARLPT